MKYLKKFESLEDNSEFKTDDSLLTGSYEEVQVTDLLGKRIYDIKYSDNEMLFVVSTDNDEERYVFFHDQDCCESCWLEDIIGDLDDLIGPPILKAEVKTNYNEGDKPKKGYVDDSFTWTFYTFATIKGYVDLRFFGTSNGYYSEEFKFVKLLD